MTTTATPALDIRALRPLIQAALAEDRADHDVTTNALVPPEQRGRAVLLAKAPGVLAGLACARETFAAVDSALSWRALLADGADLRPGDRIAEIAGPLASILRGERVALNYLCHLSGVATAARDVVRRLEGTGCRLRDTRKTTPGLRALQKYATAVGGATNHRLDLADGVLIKDNHLAAVRLRRMTIADAIDLARAANPGMRVEVEVTTLDEAGEAIEAGTDEMLLDNMSPGTVREVVGLARSVDAGIVLEASGGITPENARAYGETGVDFISMGAITHSAPALDLSLEVEPL